MIHKILTVCLLFTSVAATAQKKKAIDDAIADYAEAYSPERAYLHYDKPSYAPGETIWFKVYLMNELSPADQSKTFYTDFIDDKGNLLQHTVSPVVDGGTNGQFEIPVEYKGAYIHVRAYTRWMLNFDSAFLYRKNIRVLGNEVSSAGAKTAPIPSIQFFPEGGDAVAGIPNKIAFKANDQWGRPVKVKGVINDSEGKQLDSFRVKHDGMGFFFLVPKQGLSYTAKWKDEKNVEHVTPLPAAKPGGASLLLTVSGDSRKFLVSYSPELAAASDSLYLVGTLYQHEVFRIARATSTPDIRGTIPVKELPSGIMTITLFDNKWNPLAERITYINNGEYLFQPEMEVQHWGLNKRARNEVKITVPDSTLANLSVSVTDAAISRDSSNTIVSHLLLSSELKGDVYNPSYYFSENTPAINENLDLVMLTNGWRRFKWEEVLAGNKPRLPFGRDTSYMSLSGSILGVTQGMVEPGTTVVLLLKQKNTQGQMLVLPIKSDGSFNDPETIIFDTAQVYYSFQNKSLRNSTIQFMPGILAMPTIKQALGRNFYAYLQDTAGNYRQQLLAKEANEWTERFRFKTLENVTVKSRTKTPLQLMDEKYTSGLFTSGDGYQFDVVNDPFAASSMNIFNYLQGKVAGLMINTSGGNTSLQWRGGTPGLYLDEMATDVDMISSVNVNDVAYIKVFRPPFLGGFNGGNGAIAIYTRRGNDVKSDPGKGLANNKVQGYTLVKQFYSPNYSTFTQQNEQRDLRTTLYWNPTVSVKPGQSSVVISFYNNDVAKSFRVIIEGMTHDGRLAHIEQIME